MEDEAGPVEVGVGSYVHVTHRNLVTNVQQGAAVERKYVGLYIEYRYVQIDSVGTRQTKNGQVAWIIHYFFPRRIKY